MQLMTNCNSLSDFLIQLNLSNYGDLDKGLEDFCVFGHKYLTELNDD